MTSCATDQIGEALARPAPVNWPHDTSEQLAMRQLRHHSKNALQHLLCQVAGNTNLLRDPAGRALAADLERRIHLSATLSDALFGLTRKPGPLALRLDALCQAVVGLLSDGDQLLTVSVTIHDITPPELDNLLVRVAHELVGNAIKHGMKLRMVGRIEISVDATLNCVVMTVGNDGWPVCNTAGRGEGLSIAHGLAEQHGGELHLDRDRCFTTATLTVPLAGSGLHQ